MFSHTFIVKWMNTITDVHSAVEKSLFWSNNKKKYSLLVGKQVIVSTLGTLIGVSTLRTPIRVLSVGTRTT